MTEQIKSLGGFRIAPTAADGLGDVVISDPCYDADARAYCAAERRVLAGPWLAGVQYSRDRRVASLFAQHQDYIWAGLPWQRDPAHPALGVDSGQLGFFSAPHYRYDGDVAPGHVFAADWLPLTHSKPGDAWYDLCCDLTTGAQRAGVLAYGCVSSSGYGDGSYQLQTQTNEAGVIVGLRVAFIGAEDAEDEEGDYHDWNDEDEDEEDDDADDDA